MPNNLLKKSVEIKAKAEEFLFSHHITDILSNYGEIVFAGSYTTNLMVWNDIDIQLILPNSDNYLEVFTSLAKDFLELETTSKVQLLNFYHRKDSNMPRGMCMGLYSKLPDGTKWKVDIWSLAEEELVKSQAFQQLMLSKLNPELRELIIKLKFQLMGEQDRVPKNGSYFIYKAIFEENILEEKDIINYLKERGILE
ncbi:MAG: hypothetical protein J0H68_05805 [Sphingobacteriia bacterium]|nr:hypothetical protein [Sphingobacteriia bacterium]